jgi:type III secretory pathway component EscU
MRLIKRLIELAFIILIISLFMKNKDVELQITYFGLSAPIKVAFWELVTLCVSVGIIIAAVGDFLTQLKWLRERRRMIKTDKEHHSEVDRLNARIQGLESDNKRLEKELEQKSKELSAFQNQDTAPTGQGETSTGGVAPDA